MADDNIILNFATPDPNFKGNTNTNAFNKVKGNWKQKRKIQLINRSKANGENRRVRKEKKDGLEEYRPPKELLLSGLNLNAFGGIENDIDKDEVKDKGFKNKRDNRLNKEKNVKKSNKKVINKDKNLDFETNKPLLNIESDSEEDVFDKLERQNKEQEEVISQPGVISSLFTKNPTLPKLEYSNDNRMLTSSNGILSDASDFQSLGLDASLVQHLEAKFNVVKPTSVQAQTLSYFKAQGEQDVIVQSETGSGKTLSFLLPIVDSLIKSSGEMEPSDSFKPDRTSGLMALILAPTRELARQIHQVLEKLLLYPNIKDGRTNRFHWLVSGLVVGGDKKGSEKARLRKGVNILVATPGRFLDHLENTKNLQVNRLKWVVLDEGDRFLELGLQETLKKIFELLKKKENNFNNTNNKKAIKGNWFWNSKHMPKNRRCILVSATLNSAVAKLAEYTLMNPIHLKASNKDDVQSDSDNDEEENPTNAKYNTPNQLLQNHFVVPAKQRLITLIALLKDRLNKGGKVLVFMLTCEQVEFLFQLLTSYDNEKNEDKDQKGNEEKLSKNIQNCPLLHNIPVFKLHGSLTSAERTFNFQQFSKHESGLLLCTDVAARGLDMPYITSIIQYDPPLEVKDYVHRVGRTARLGKAGEAILFLLPSEIDYITTLNKLKINVGAKDSLEILKKMATKEADYQTEATRIQNSLESHILNHQELHNHSRRAYTSYLRAYATYPSALKDIFHLKKLHLGHLAKSFGLREAPQQTVASQKKQRAEKEKLKKRARSYGEKEELRLKKINKGEFDMGDI